MKIIKPQTLSLLTRPFEFRRDYWLGCAVVAFLPIGETHTLLPEADLWPFLTEELPSDQPLDAAIPKTRTEFVAIAHAFAPGGVAAPMVPTGIQLGASIKQLDVFGDREFDRSRGRITEPVPFTRMKIDWTRAYGGDGFADNPLGRGAVPVDGSDGRIFPVENVIDRAHRGEGVRSPAAYGPVDQMWPARAKLSGTYDDAWLKQDFPGFARDIDWHFFNIAPADQWLAEPLQGHEAYAFKNLHPTVPLLKGRLPGLTPRLFLTRKGHDDSFEEVPLTLTTLWFFPHRERLVLVHHGRARLAEEDGSDIARVTIGADRIGALRQAADFRAVMVKRADARDGALYALRDQDLVAEEFLAPAPARPDAEPSPLQKSPGATDAACGSGECGGTGTGQGRRPGSRAVRANAATRSAVADARGTACRHRGGGSQGGSGEAKGRGRDRGKEGGAGVTACRCRDVGRRRSRSGSTRSPKARRRSARPPCRRSCRRRSMRCTSWGW